MPPMPDNVTWAYDPKRDQGVLMPAYYGAGISGCTPAYAGTVTGVSTTTLLPEERHGEDHRPASALSGAKPCSLNDYRSQLWDDHRPSRVR